MYNVHGFIRCLFWTIVLRYFSNIFNIVVIYVIVFCFIFYFKTEQMSYSGKNHSRSVSRAILEARKALELTFEVSFIFLRYIFWHLSRASVWFKPGILRFWADIMNQSRNLSSIFKKHLGSGFCWTKSWRRRNFKKFDWLFRGLGTRKYWQFREKHY